MNGRFFIASVGPTKFVLVGFGDGQISLRSNALPKYFLYRQLVRVFPSIESVDWIDFI